MHFVVFTLAAWLASPALAAQTPNFARCKALAAQRDSDVGHNTHANFMSNCLAGKIPELPLAKSSTPRQAARVESYGKCEALAEQRGSQVGHNTHARFIASCMAGKVH